MNDFERAALVIGLRKLFNEQKWFCIIDFDNLLSLAKISVPQQERKAFAVLHCVHYSEMPRGFKEELFQRVIEIFRRDPDVQIRIEEIFPPEPVSIQQPNVVRRIFGYLKAVNG